MRDDALSAVWQRVTAPTAKSGNFLIPLWLSAQSAAEEYAHLVRCGGRMGECLGRAARAQRENALCLQGMLRAQLCPLPRTRTTNIRPLYEALRARLPECRESYRQFAALSPDAGFGPVFARMAERQALVWEALLEAVAEA